MPLPSPYLPVPLFLKSNQPESDPTFEASFTMYLHQACDIKSVGAGRDAVLVLAVRHINFVWSPSQGHRNLTKILFCFRLWVDLYQKNFEKWIYMNQASDNVGISKMPTPIHLEGRKKIRTWSSLDIIHINETTHIFHRHWVHRRTIALKSNIMCRKIRRVLLKFFPNY